MGQLPGIYTIQASDAPQHTDRLQGILQNLKTEKRVGQFTTLSPDEVDGLSNRVDEDDLILIILTRQLEPQREQVVEKVSALKGRVAEIIIDNIVFDNEFLTFPADLRPLREREDLDGVWDSIEQSLKEMFPVKDEEKPVPVDWPKYLKIAGIIVTVILAFFIIRGLLTGDEDGNVNGFEVTDAAAAVSGRTTYTGECPHKFDFSAKVTVNQPGQVRYTWLRSDGANAPEQTLEFTEAGSQTVHTSWTLGATGRTYSGYWQQLQITAPNELLSNRAEFNLRCVDSTPQGVNLNFRQRGASRVISQGSLAQDGIRVVRASPSGGYCANAQPAILAEGTYNSPSSFLSTANQGQLNSCNGVPLEFIFRQPVRSVNIYFYGAATDYLLTAWDANGNRLGSSSAQGSPYDYDQPFSVTYSSDNADISRITFGHQAALTMVLNLRAR